MIHFEDRPLTQEVFADQPEAVNWCGVDYDGKLSFGIAINPRYTYFSARWKGFKKVGEPIQNSGYDPLTSLKRK